MSYGDDDDRELQVEDIRRELAAGRISRNTIAWREGLADWLPLDGIGELRSLFDGPLAQLTDTTESAALLGDSGGSAMELGQSPSNVVRPSPVLEVGDDTGESLTASTDATTAGRESQPPTSARVVVLESSESVHSQRSVVSIGDGVVTAAPGVRLTPLPPGSELNPTEATLPLMLCPTPDATSDSAPAEDIPTLPYVAPPPQSDDDATASDGGRFIESEAPTRRFVPPPPDALASEDLADSVATADPHTRTNLAPTIDEFPPLRRPLARRLVPWIGLVLALTLAIALATQCHDRKPPLVPVRAEPSTSAPTLSAPVATVPQAAGPSPSQTTSGPVNDADFAKEFAATKKATKLFDRAAAERAAEAAVKRARMCGLRKGVTGSATVTLTFKPSGQVLSLEVKKPHTTSYVGRCLQQVFDDVRVPEFEGASESITVTVPAR